MSDLDYQNDGKPASWKRTALTGLTVATGAFAVIICASFLNKASSGIAGFGSLAVSGIMLMLIVFSTMLLWGEVQKEKRMLEELRRPDNEGGVPNEVLSSGSVSEEMLGNDAAKRVITVMWNQVSHNFLPEKDKFIIKDNELESYRFKATRTGEVSKGAIKSAAFTSLRGAVPGNWSIDFDTHTDRITATQRETIPNIVAPPNYPVATTRDEAVRLFKQEDMYIGQSEDGEVRYKLNRQPHAIVVGPTGGGKSVFMRSQIMQRTAVGHRVFIVDGKGTDYQALSSFPNVAMVSSTLPDHIINIHMVVGILKGRESKAKSRTKNGESNWESSIPPVTLVIDEWANLKNELDSVYKNDAKEILKDIEEILRIGRQFRVFVILGSQDIYAKSMPGTWRNNFSLIVSVGNPIRQTISSIFPEELHTKVQRMGAAIPSNQKGRAIIVSATDSGTSDARYVQTPFTYSPAENPDNAPESILPKWESFKRNVTDKITHLYPRSWVRIDGYPDPPETGKDPYREVRDVDVQELGVDLTIFTIKDLHRLVRDPVMIEDMNTKKPLPDRSVYDPRSYDYRGQSIDPLADNSIDFW